MITEIFLLAIFLLILYSAYAHYQRKINGWPPGPFAWPIVGNLLQFDAARPQRTCQKWAQTYGPVFTIWLAHQPTIIITDYELMKDAIIKRGEEFVSRPRNSVFEFFTHGNFGIVTATGELWREQRRFSLQILRNFGFGRDLMAEKILAEANRMSSWIIEDLTSAKSNIINLSMNLQLCVGNIISSILLGHTFDKEDQKFRTLKETLDENFKLLASPKIIILQSFPWLRYLPLFGHFGMDELQRHHYIFTGFLSGELEMHKRELEKNGDQDEPTDFTAAYLKEIKRRQIAGDPMSFFGEWQLLSILADLWIAGMETTVTTLRWGILAMMTNAEAQQKVHEEIDAAIGQDKSPSMSDRQSMPYIMATLNEIQRWGNILPINLPRMTDNNVELAGYTIPKGVTVIPQISVLHIDERIFPSPYEFKPERFLDSDMRTPAKIEEFAPFSMGKRQCLGEGLARAELFLIFVTLMQKFRFDVPPNKPPPKLDPLMGLTSAPQPYDCMISIR